MLLALLTFAHIADAAFLPSRSKTMIGYGDEDRHFVLELTYNYGIFEYARVRAALPEKPYFFGLSEAASEPHSSSSYRSPQGNDFAGILVESAAAHERARAAGHRPEPDGSIVLAAPGGYPFRVAAPPAGMGQDGERLAEVALNVASVAASETFYCGLLGMAVQSRAGGSVRLTYGQGQATLVLQQLPAGQTLDHAEARAGRVSE